MYMIAGPNGAGKSTLYENSIKHYTDAPFINADIIQRDELKDASMQASYKAAEVAETRRREHLEQGKSFVSESTFSHPSKLQLISDAKEAGFRVALYHVNLRSPDLSVDRVARRLGEGGHDVPEDKIRERFARNPALIKEAAILADRAFIYDNSALNRPLAMAIELRRGNAVWASEQVPTWARTLYAKELEPFSAARLNAAAASFADAKVIAEKIGGESSILRIPGTNRGQSHEGKMVGQTALHWVQQVQDKTFLAHFRTALPQNLELQRNYHVNYAARGQAEIVPVQERKNEQTAQQPATRVSAPRHDLNKNQAVIHTEATQNVAKHVQEMQKQPGLGEKSVEDLGKLAFWRGVVAENTKLQPPVQQSEALARFDKQAEDPQFLKRLSKETEAKATEKTADHPNSKGDHEVSR